MRALQQLVRTIADTRGSSFTRRLRKPVPAYEVDADVYDNFARWTLAGIGSRIPPIRSVPNTWLAKQGNIVVVDGRAELRFATSSPDIGTFNLGEPNVRFRARVSLSSTGTARTVAVVVRFTATNNLIQIALTKDQINATLSANSFKIVRVQSGTGTVLAELAGGFTPVAGTWYDIEVTANEDTITATLDGANQIQATGVTFNNTATEHGLRGGNSVGGGAHLVDHVRMDILAVAPSDVTVTVGEDVLMTSKLETGFMHVDGTELRFGNATAIARAKTYITDAIAYQRHYIMSGGVNDPWDWNGSGERPAEPTNWTSLDAAMNYMVETGAAGKILLTIQLYPWHIKGIFQTDGSTRVATPADEWTEDGSPMTSELDNMLLLVQRTCERYMVAPYNVRHFVLGGEYHGFQLGTTGAGVPSFFHFAWRDIAGTPGQNADMQMGYFHNRLVERIEQVATALGIPLNTLMIGNNYPRLRGQGTPTGVSVSPGHPLYGKVWGTAENRTLVAAVTGMTVLNRLDFAVVDMGTSNTSGGYITDVWTNLERYTDFIEYLKTEWAAIGYPDIPICMAEWYSTPQTDPGANSQVFRAALKAEAMRRMLLAGVWLPLLWGVLGRAETPGTTTDAALITKVDTADGGEKTPWYDVLKLFHDHFSAGTAIYDVTIVGDGVNALASALKVLLINKTGEAKTVRVGATVYDLDPYEVMAVDR